MCKGSETYQSLGGSGSINNWAFGAGDNFGVTANGDIYCKSGQIGNLTINGDFLRGTTNANCMYIYPNGTTISGSSYTYYIVIYKNGAPVGGITPNGWISL